ncbi:hypothetical protein BGX29_004346, partial [Mortierella sp. GBA35]
MYGSRCKTIEVKLVNHLVLLSNLTHMPRQIDASHTWTKNVIYQMLPKGLQVNRLGGSIALLKTRATQMPAREKRA